MTADVLTSLTQRESEECLRFEMHEIRNLAFHLVSDRFAKSASIDQQPAHSSLYPGKLIHSSVKTIDGACTMAVEQ